MGVQGECRKDDKHADNVERIGGCCVPLVVATHGVRAVCTCVCMYVHMCVHACA